MEGNSNSLTARNTKGLGKDHGSIVISDFAIDLDLVVGRSRNGFGFPLGAVAKSTTGAEVFPIDTTFGFVN